MKESTIIEVNGNIVLIANSFPKELYAQWKENCLNIYNDVHWAKIWSDHLKAQAYDKMLNVEGKI